MVPDAVARALAIRERPTTSLVAALQNAIRGRQLLLILDNCEHLVAACAELSDALLRACPHLRILSTSREPLEIGAERIWRVPPLHVPEITAGATLESLGQSEAAALFVERASAARAEFLPSDESATAIAEICRRLDGIPLAIELAASRAKHLAIQQIADHLDDQLSLLSRGSRTSPSRQQTLRATIDWSYQLLSDSGRLLFDRVSVFSGGWTLEAAQAVCAADAIHESDILDLLGQLVDIVEDHFGPLGHLQEPVGTIAAPDQPGNPTQPTSSQSVRSARMLNHWVAPISQSTPDAYAVKMVGHVAYRLQASAAGGTRPRRPRFAVRVNNTHQPSRYSSCSRRSSPSLRGRDPAECTSGSSSAF